MGRPSPFSHTAADGFGIVPNSHGKVRGSELGQAEDSCAPSPIFPLIVLGASEASWVLSGVLSQFDQFAVQ